MILNDIKKKYFIDLSHQLDCSIPTWDDKNDFKIDTQNYGIFRVQNFCLSASLGTHIDFPAHISKDYSDAIGFDAQDFCALCNILYIDDYFCDLYGIDNLETLVITKAMIEDFEKDNKQIQPNSWFIVRTGWCNYWSNRDKYRNKNEFGLMQFPSLSIKAAEFLLRRNIKGFGIDTLSPDCPSNKDSRFLVHELFLSNKIYIIENINFPNNFDANMYSNDSYLYVSPLLIKGATESPVRIFLSK